MAMFATILGGNRLRNSLRYQVRNSLRYQRDIGYWADGRFRRPQRLTP